jgi:hypothetical protein
MWHFKSLNVSSRNVNVQSCNNMKRGMYPSMFSKIWRISILALGYMVVQLCVITRFRVDNIPRWKSNNLSIINLFYNHIFFSHFFLVIIRFDKKHHFFLITIIFISSTKHLSSVLLRTTNDDQLFLFFHFHIFMSISNLILINIHFMDMERQVKLFFNIHVGG